MNVPRGNKVIENSRKINSFGGGSTEAKTDFFRMQCRKINMFREGVTETKDEYVGMQSRKVEFKGVMETPLNLSIRDEGNEDNIQEKQYLQTLSEKEFKAYEIAKKCLGTSFQLKKSNGYLSWLKEKPIFS